MDEPTVILQQSFFKTRKWKIVLSVIVIVIISVILAIGIPFLFQKPVTKPSPVGKSSPGPAQAPAILSIKCPVSEEFCQKGTVINNDAFYGIYFTLPVNTPLLTVFSGQLSDQPKAQDRLATQPLLYLRNKNLEAIYSFYGNSAAMQSKGYVNQEEIGKIGAGQFPSVAPFAGSNFLLSIKKDGKFIKFKVE